MEYGSTLTRSAMRLRSMLAHNDSMAAGLGSKARSGPPQRGEHGLGAHGRAYVEEDVSFSEVMKKAHIFEVVETATYVLRRAVHSTGYQEPGTICKRCGHRRSRVPFANGRSTHAPKGHLRIEGMTPDMAHNIEP